MKRIGLAGVSLLALATIAAAADLPRRSFPGQAPAYIPIYNWTGFYIGINGGGAWGNSTWDSIGSFDVAGFLVGGTAGYNWQAGQFVFGLEGDYAWTNIDGSTGAACPTGCQTSNGWLATVRGRIGYAFDRFLPYVTGGLAIGDIKTSQPGFVGGHDTNVGFSVGGGLEFAISMAGNWTVKAEYLYVDLGKFNCGLGCGNGLNPDNVSFSTHLVRGGVNFRF
jgi:outer membrane immunogenic protein